VEPANDIATQEFEPGETETKDRANEVVLLPYEDKYAKFRLPNGAIDTRAAMLAAGRIDAVSRVYQPPFEQYPERMISTIDELRELVKMLNYRPGQYNVFIWINEDQSRENCMTEHVRVFWWKGEHPRYSSQVLAYLQTDHLGYPYLAEKDNAEESRFLKAFYNLKVGVNYIVNTLGEEKYIHDRQTEPAVFSSYTLVQGINSREVDYIKWILADNTKANIYRVRTTLCRTPMKEVEVSYSKENACFTLLTTAFNYKTRNYVIIQDFRKPRRTELQEESEEDSNEENSNADKE
jgi:hypothetical protein